MSKKLTPWFPGEVAPAHVGFYERDYGFGDEETGDYWDGDRWWVVPVLAHEKRLPSSVDLPWRGLAEKP